VVRVEGVWEWEIRCGQSALGVSEVCGVVKGTRRRRKETHIVQPLEHALEHSRPFGAVAGQLRLRGGSLSGTHMSMEPS
jgi:hypothetical protein